MMNMRPYRFPPLSNAVAGGALEAGSRTELQTSLAEGFQEGMDRGYQEGYREGYDTGLRTGREDGRREGTAEGRREALAGLETLAKPVNAIFESLKQLQDDYQSALRREVVDLVAKVSRQVIRCELALQPTQLLTLVDEALAAMPRERGEIEVYLNPDDLQRIAELDPNRAARWTLVPDARLEPGECRVKAGDREADAGCRQRLAACIDQIHAQLVEPANAEELAG